jgi:predicted ester cyclase
MGFGKDMLFLGGYLSVATVQAEIAAAAAAAAAPAPTAAPKEIVAGFLRDVRSGVHPERAADYLAARVVAHQLTAEPSPDVLRDPANYARHVAEFRRSYGQFSLEVTELIGDGDRVYARWRQTGCHVGDVDGHAPTHRPIVELASAVYRVADGRIVEYWIQVDRAGTDAQLRANAALPALAACA